MMEVEQKENNQGKFVHQLIISFAVVQFLEKLSSDITGDLIK